MSGPHHVSELHGLLDRQLVQDINERVRALARRASPEDTEFNRGIIEGIEQSRQIVTKAFQALADDDDKPDF